MKKYLFLDIDGALNHLKWNIGLDRRNFKYPYSEFDPECVENLKHILDETGAKLVLSSSWRLDPDIHGILSNVGLPYDFEITTNNLDRHRGSEIKTYLENKEKPYTYCIIDDGDDFLPEQVDNLVITSSGENGYDDICEMNGGTGLTSKCVKKAILILN